MNYTPQLEMGVCSRGHTTWFWGYKFWRKFLQQKFPTYWYCEILMPTPSNNILTSSMEPRMQCSPMWKSHTELYLVGPVKFEIVGIGAASSHLPIMFRSELGPPNRSTRPDHTHNHWFGSCIVSRDLSVKFSQRMNDNVLLRDTKLLRLMGSIMKVLWNSSGEMAGKFSQDLSGPSI